MIDVSLARRISQGILATFGGFSLFGQEDPFPSQLAFAHAIQDLEML
jgi:hypothetical protein